MNKTCKVGLIGFGRAGRAVAQVLAASEEVELAWVVRRSADNGGEDSASGFNFYPMSELAEGRLLEHSPVDILVDFSSPLAIWQYGPSAAARGVRVVTAISNYGEADLRLIADLSVSTPILCSPNITVGINFLMLAARMLRDVAPFADVEVVEEHFRDKPERSGTAMRIASSLGLGEEQVNSIRVGGIVGRHEVIFGFPYQTVRLTHDSISRHAFGTGALYAARHLLGKPPGLYAFEELMREDLLRSLAVFPEMEQQALLPAW